MGCWRRRVVSTCGLERWLRSDLMDGDAATEGACEPREIVGVARHDEVMTGDRSDHDGRVDDVRRASSRAGNPGGSRPMFIEGLHATTTQEA